MSQEQVMIVISVVVFVLFCLTILIIELYEHRQKHCKSCKHKFDYETEVTWQCKDNCPCDEQTHATSATYYADVNFVCVCSNCGKQKQFTKRFRLDPLCKGCSLEKKIKSWFCEK